MTATATLSDPQRARAYVEFLRPECTKEGLEPEGRVVHYGMSWESYLAFDEALGDDRPGPRFYYLDGALEIMTTSNEHERLTMWFAGLMDLYLDEIGIEAITRGQATMRLAGQQAGAEPDLSWCLHTEREFPDLVLEIALTSGGVRKLELYRRFAVPEVWFWRRGQLDVFVLREDGTGYDPLEAGRSRLLPGLDLHLMERCVTASTRQEARLAFRVGLAAGR